MPSWFSRRPPSSATSLPPAASSSASPRPPRSGAPPPPSAQVAAAVREAQSPESSALDKYLFGDSIAMMEEPTPLGVGVTAAPHEFERPSILEFRSSRFSRVNPQRAQMLAAMAHAANSYTMPPKQPPHSLFHAYSDDGDSDDELQANHDRDTLNKTAFSTSRSTTSSMRTTEKTNAGDDDDDDQQLDLDRDDNDDDDNDGEDYDTFSTSDMDASADEYEFDDDELLTIMSMPASQEVPLLEVPSEDDDDEQEVDMILMGDRPPARALPRTMIVDEHGFQLSRESVLVTAARLDGSAPLKTGLLFKQGFSLLRGKGGGSGGWKVRHVELTGSKLAFFREEHGRRRGEIDLTQCSTKSIEIMPRDSVYDGAHATVWRFAVRGRGGRRVLLAAYSEAEMKDWLRALHVALAVQSGAGMGRFTDFGVVPTGTFLADKSDGLLRSSANFR